MISKIVLAVGLAMVNTDVQTSAPSLADKLRTELGCLAANLYFEARGEPLKGQLAVAKVTLNRVKSKQYPDSICAVVFQKSQFSWTKQQPWTKIQRALNHVEPSKNPLEVSAYQQAWRTARNSLKTDLNGILPDDALWYHSTAVNPKWNREMKKVKKVGSHIFYSKEKQ